MSSFIMVFSILINISSLFLLKFRTGGISCLIASWLITFYSLWQLVQLHEAVPGKRFDRYHELGQHAFGPKLGLWIVVPQQLLVQASTNIVYGVTGGKSLKKFFDLIIPSGSIRLTYFIIIFGGIQLFLSQTPNFNSLKGISLLAAFMSFWYVTEIWHLIEFWVS